MHRRYSPTHALAACGSAAAIHEDGQGFLTWLLRGRRKEVQRVGAPKGQSTSSQCGGQGRGLLRCKLRRRSETHGQRGRCADVRRKRPIFLVPRVRGIGATGNGIA